MYFVRRKGKIRGPLTLEKLQSLRDQDRLRMRDEIGESADGPWTRLADIYDELLGDPETNGDDQSGLDDDFLIATPSSRRQSSRQRLVNASPKRSRHNGLFGRQLKPWQMITAGVGLACLAILTVTAGILLSPAVSEPKDDDEAVAEERPPMAASQVKSKPATASPAQAGPPARAQVASATPRTGKTPAVQPSTMPAPPTESTPPETAIPQAESATATDLASIDHEAGIKAVLTAYYSASSWEERYRTAVPGDDVKKLISSLYEDVDWVSVQWSVVTMPTQDELVAAAKDGQRIRVDTLTNGNPHAIFLAFSQGQWQVDWLQSLNRLWLSK
jgi:hypothetical protein